MPNTYSELALTTRATLKAYLDPPPPGSTADALFDGLITRASALIAEAVNWPVLFDSGADITEKRNGNNQTKLLVKASPIVSVTSLKIGNATILLSDGASSGYLFDEDTIYLIGYVFDRGYQNVTLVYRGGISQTSRQQAMLEQACLVTAATWWKRRSHLDVTSLSPQGVGSVNYTMKDIPAEAWTVINQLKKVAPWI